MLLKGAKAVGYGTTCPSVGRTVSPMQDLLALAATAFAIPQLLPQLRRVRRVGTAGVSVQWAALTAVGNGAWLGYFAATGLRGAFLPVTCSGLLAAAIVWSMARRGAAWRAGLLLAAGWAALLAAVAAVGGVGGLGIALATAFTVQVAPSLREAWRAEDRSGISIGTWLLVGGEVLCWGAIGVLASRPPLMALGLTGSLAAGAMLWMAAARPAIDPMSPVPPAAVHK